MPADASMAKVDATRSYGAEVVLAGEGFDEAMAAAQERVTAGATFVHAFDDPLVVAGPGTPRPALAGARCRERARPGRRAPRRHPPPARADEARRRGRRRRGGGRAPGREGRRRGAGLRDPLRRGHRTRASPGGPPPRAPA